MNRPPRAVDGSPSCRDCKHFHELTETRDEVAWGECWRDPPLMAAHADDETGEAVYLPVKRWHELPYVCDSLKPKQ